MSDKDLSQVKIPIFKGNKKDWVQWSEMFLARAKRKGYKSVLIDDKV